MPLRLIFMGTPDFAVPTLLELVGAGHEIAAVYTRAAKPGGAAAWSCSRRRSSARRERLGIPVLTPATLKTPEAQADFRAHQRRCRGRRRLWPDPAEADPRCAAARLLQPARLAAAALARRRADQPRHHGRRRRDRRHGDADGRRPRHRRRRDGRAHARSRADMTAGDLHDRAGAARRRPDGARAGRAGARRACSSRRRAADGVTYAAKIDKAETRIDWTRPCARGARHIRGLSPFPGAWCEIETGDRREGPALRAGEGRGRARQGARRSSHHRLRRRRGPHPRAAARRQARRCRPRISCAARRCKPPARLT